MKCDRQLPSCSQCVAAKTTCTGISSTVNAAVPRSIVQHLESEIARLETELLCDGQLEVVQASDILLQMPGRPSETPTPVAESADQRIMNMEQQVYGQSGHSQSGHREQSRQGGQSHSDTEAFTRLRSAIIESCALQAMVAATLPSGSGATELLSRVRMGMTPSSAKVGTSARPASSSRMKASPRGTVSGAVGAGGPQGMLSAATLQSIPWDIVTRLMRKYLTTIHNESPFLVPATVVGQFSSVAETLAGAVAQGVVDMAGSPLVLPSHDFLTVYIVLAVAVTLGSATDGYEERCTALSVALFDEGIAHLHSLASFPSDLAWLQTTLLILLYATVVPRCANVWVLSGVVMRSALELGLHREAPRSISLDGPMRELRRRIFWAAYCMDRSICAALQRPFSTPDMAIATRLPTGAEAEFHRSIGYHRLVSEILAVHFHHEPLRNGLGWDEWLVDVERRLDEWASGESYGTKMGGTSRGVDAVNTAKDATSLDSTKNSTNADSANTATAKPADTATPNYSGYGSTDLARARALMTLHRPSPRVPFPSSSSLLHAFEAACAAERLHRTHIHAGFFRRPWVSAHHTLEAATVVLFALRHAHAAIARVYTPSAVFDMTKLLTGNFLAIAAQGWREVAVYAGVYERLLGPLIERIFLGGDELGERFGAAQDAELMRLLYPGPAQLENLRLGFRQRQEEFSPFDFNVLMADEDFWGGTGFMEGEEVWDMSTELQFIG